jgi:hypothetical protein
MFAFLQLRRDKPPTFNYKEMKMEKVIETKTAVVAKSSSGSTVVLFVAVVDGEPSEAQIETGRNALAATLEIVGAANTSSYLLRHKKVNLAADESLLLTVDSTYSKISPDSFPTVESGTPEA